MNIHNDILGTVVVWVCVYLLYVRKYLNVSCFYYDLELRVDFLKCARVGRSLIL